MHDKELTIEIESNVRSALKEDVGSGDLTAMLIDEDAVSGATVVAREPLIVAGQDWFNEVFRQLDDTVVVDWYIGDGQDAEDGDVICKLVGNTRALLTGERTALNFLQTLSATATATSHYVNAIGGSRTRILDTRKTLPCLRLAQKYAVRCGGGQNHRMGLYDAVLIKENHIRSAGSIRSALSTAQSMHPDRLIEVEVESIEEFKEALDAGASRILLDNFLADDIREAANLNAAFGALAAELEISGDVTLENIRDYANLGVDFISIGALTKNVRAADLSMLFRID